jgi:hypothetical protein
MAVFNPFVPAKPEIDVGSGGEYVCSMGFSKYYGAPEEVAEEWKIKEELIEEYYADPAKCRSIDSAGDILQVLAIAFKAKLGERWEVNAFQQGYVSAFSVSTRSRGSEANEKFPEPGQCGQACDDLLG